MLQGWITLPSLVIPVSMLWTNDVAYILSKVDAYIQNHGLLRSPGSKHAEIFCIRSNRFRFYRTYALLYQYKPDNELLKHNLMHKTQFAY